MRPVLSEDVCRFLLEEAARSDKQTALELVCVSRRVQAWIEPIIYETIIVDNTRRLVYLLRTLNEPVCKSRTFFADSVKYLWISESCEVHEVAIMLSAFTGIRAFAFWPRFPHLVSNPQLRDTALEALEKVRPQRISGYMEHLAGFPPDFGLPIFKNVTHLEISDDWDHWHAWKTLTAENLPSLWYISVDLARKYIKSKEKAFGSAINRFLENCPQVKLFLVFLSLGHRILESGGNFPKVEDRRVVYLPSEVKILPEGGLKQWNTYAKGDPDLWAQGEQILRSRGF